MESVRFENVGVTSQFPANPVNRDPLSTAIQNALIVEEISKYITISDMINCRSANNFSKTEWTPAIRKRSNFQLCLTDKKAMLLKDWEICLNKSPVLDGDNQAKSHFDKMNANEIDTLASWLIQWMSRRIHNFPCSRFRVGTQAFKLVNKREQKKFFGAIGSVATELYLEQTYGDPPFHPKVLKNLDVVFSNLTKLQIELTFVTPTAFSFYKNVIQLAPSLACLSLNNRNGNDYGLLAGCINAICNPKPLKTLQISGAITNNLLEKLAEKKLKLTKLELFFETFSNFLPEAFESFLSCQSNSLKQLYFKCKVIVPRSLAIIFPEMCSLELLKIDIYDGLRFPALNLQQAFPKLKHLRMLGVEAENIPDFNLSKQPLKTLEEFNFRRALANQNDILQICGISPNLKKLSVPCERSIITLLNSARLNYLEEITLLGETVEMMHNMNEILTGYSRMELVAHQRGILVEMERQPLGFLQKVKILRLEKGFLNDVLCKLGPMKLQSLQCLDLRISRPNVKHMISNTMLEEMRKRFTVLLSD